MMPALYHTFLIYETQIIFFQMMPTLAYLLAFISYIAVLRMLFAHKWVGITRNLCLFARCRILPSSICRFTSMLRAHVFCFMMTRARVCGRQKRNSKVKKTLNTRGCSFTEPLDTRGALHARHTIHWKITKAFFRTYWRDVKQWYHMSHCN